MTLLVEFEVTELLNEVLAGFGIGIDDKGFCHLIGHVVVNFEYPFPSTSDRGNHKKHKHHQRNGTH